MNFFLYSRLAFIATLVMSIGVSSLSAMKQQPQELNVMDALFRYNEELYKHKKIVNFIDEKTCALLDKTLTASNMSNFLKNLLLMENSR